nr:TlpA disulfide reductase family protein [uncultured Draconibacterium sp.]
MKKEKLISVFTLAALFLICNVSKAQLLKGIINADSIPILQIAYTPDGDVINTTYHKLQPDKDGKFSFNTDLIDQTCDVGVYVGEEIFGAHLEKGKTTNIYLEKKSGKENFEIRFGGDNVELSKVYNAYTQAFDIFKYFSIDPALSKSFQEYRDILQKEYTALNKKLATIKDDQWQAYYIKLSEGMYKWTQIRLIMDECFEENIPLAESPEYLELINAIDPNDEASLRTNLSVAWLGGKVKQSMDGNDDDNTPYFVECMELVENQITNPKVRTSLTRYIPYLYFTMGAGKGDVNVFWNRFKIFAKDYPELISDYESNVKSFVEIKKGDDVPYNPVLTKTDGTTCKLSDLSGYLVYIDIWATWCVPCVKEIPHLEKVAEHFKGNDKIKIISISVDENRDAWLKKLAKDQPEWEQYILTPEEEEKFMKAWNIGGIPRFIVLDKDGKVFLADAPRPSNEELIGTLESQL